MNATSSTGPDLNATTSTRANWNTTIPAQTTIAKPRPTLRVNVTVNGLTLNQSLSMPGSWNATVGRQVTNSATGECPAGRYCPAGAMAPRMCKMGMFSSEIKRIEPCLDSFFCWTNYYCPDPGVLLKCPTNTVSTAGSTSLLDCRCLAGYQCYYKKQVNLNMVVNVPMGVWLSESGRILREKLVEVVAESAGVGVADVMIDQVLPYLSKTNVKGRRLLESTLGEGTLLLRLSLRGAEAVKDDALQAKLGQVLKVSKKSSPVRTRVNWARADRLHVKPKPWLPA